MPTFCSCINGCHGNVGGLGDTYVYIYVGKVSLAILCIVQPPSICVPWEKLWPKIWGSNG